MVSLKISALVLILVFVKCNGVRNIIPTLSSRDNFRALFEYESGRKAAVTAIGDGVIDNFKKIYEEDVSHTMTLSKRAMISMFADYFEINNKGFKYEDTSKPAHDASRVSRKARPVLPDGVKVYIIGCGSFGRLEATGASDLDYMIIAIRPGSQSAAVHNVFADLAAESLVYWKRLSLLSGHTYPPDNQHPGLALDNGPGIHEFESAEAFYDRIKELTSWAAQFIDSIPLYVSNGDFDEFYQGFIDHISKRDIQGYFREHYEQFSLPLLQEGALLRDGNQFSPKEKIIRPLSLPIMEMYTLRYKYHTAPKTGIMGAWEKVVGAPEKPKFYRQSVNRMIQLVRWGDLDAKEVRAIIPWFYWGLAKELQFNIGADDKLHHGRQKTLNSKEVGFPNAVIKKVAKFITHYKAKYDTF